MRRRAVELVISAGLALALVITGFLHKGVPAAQVVLNDGGVWVVNTSLRLVGHLNAQSRVLDGGLRAASNDFDIKQAAASVLIDDSAGSTWQRVEPGTVAIAGQLNSGGLEVSHGAGSVVVGDAEDGKVWAVGSQYLSSFDISQDPLLEEVPGVRVAAAVSGAAFAVEPSGALHAVEILDEGGALVKEAGSLAGEVSQDAELTTVGDAIVAFDRAAGTVTTPSATIDVVDAESAVLQQPGPQSPTVLVATATALYAYPLSGGQPTVLEAAAQGTPAAPVFHEGCGYAVWGGSGAYIRTCPSVVDTVNEVYSDLGSARDLSFRVNRSVIVINDNVSGDIYLPNDGMFVIDNWDVVQSQVDDEQDEESQDDDFIDENQAAEFTEDNSPPVAEDDEFSVRTGQSTTLPVLANDTDPDGDVLTVALEDIPADWNLGLTRGERAVRVDVPEGRSGSFTFTYRASDGREKSEPAQVTVRVVGDGDNSAPKQHRIARLQITERSSITYSILPDWMDPEGDQIYLRTVAAPEGTRVEYRQDGTITVTDLGTGGPGLREIDVVVSDGNEDASGLLRVQVSPYGVNLPPVANADFYWGRVGEPITAEPLSNDWDPNGDPLSLTYVNEDVAGAMVEPDFVNGRFQFTAQEPGSYFVRYSASDGPTKSDNEVRLDIIDPEGLSTPPVAENDLVVLPEGSAAVVDVLANDFDPIGGVLVIQSVGVPDTSGLTVEIVNHAQLRVSAPAGLPAPTSFTYVMSNGHASATASVMVLPVPAETSTLPPVAVDDEALVRVGDIVAIPVLRNDYSPTNMEIEILPDGLEVNSETGEEYGEAFISGDLLRFRAGTEPGQARVTYTIQDAVGNVDSAEVRITIVPEGTNQAPRPRQVTARVVAGNRVAIPVPFDGVDPDGDLVQLIGFASNPKEGQASLDRGFILYDAPADAYGTDTFEYTVQDQFGLTGSAQVRVGIAPRPTENQNPVAVADNIVARPNVAIEVDVLENDLDPDGDEITIINDSVESVDANAGMPDAVVEMGRVRLTTTSEPGTLQYYYRISDGNGGTARGVLSVLVDGDAPLLPPIAVDDPLTPAEILGQTEVPVDVLANDRDPDGSTAELTVEVDAPAMVDAETRQVIVPVTDERQVIMYTITDPDGLTGRAAIIVPGAEQTPPELNQELLPATVKAGDSLDIDLREWVIARGDREARLTTTTKVAAGPGWDGADLVAGDQSLRFVADVDYVGSSFIVFEVTDGTSIEDPRGLTASLRIPIVVEPSDNTPNQQPEFRPGEATVAPGEAAESFDLGPMVTDPDPGDHEKLSFSLGAVSGGFEVSLDGRSLQVSAPADARVGVTGTAQVTVTDGTTDPVTEAVLLRVSASTRPLATTRDVEITEGRSGEPVTIDLTSSVTNPFADRGEPLTITGSPTVSPAGSGAVSVSGMSVTVTPSATFDDQLVATYQIADATKDSSRFVTGVIRVTVKGQPRPPTNVTAVTNASKSATVSWTAGDLRGGVLSTFTVHWAGGSQDCGLRTVCELNRVLDNNREYTFTVTQTTEVGDSENSGPSNVVRPDVRPNPPSVPTATFGDQEISLTWQDGGVPDGGSPVDRYTVEIRPAVGGITQREVTGGSSLVWTGLTNGTPYSFAVTGHNQFEQPSHQSGFSAPEVPAGQSGPPGAPAVVKDPVSAAAPRATVRWTAPSFSNGDTSYTYELRRTGTREILYSGPGLSTTVTMPVQTEDQTFEVRATNKSKKPSDFSARSNAVRAFQIPGTPGNFTLTPTGSNNTARFDFSAATGNGARPAEIRYQWQAGTTTGWVTPGQTVTSGAFSHSGAVTVNLRAISTVNGETAQGPQAAASVHAYGPPRAPQVSASGGVDDVTLNWNGSSSVTSNGRPITNVRYEINGSQTTTGTLAGSTTRSGRDQSVSIRAQAQDSTGQWGAWSASSSAASWPSFQKPTITSVSGNTARIRIVGMTNASDVSAFRCWKYKEGRHPYGFDRSVQEGTAGFGSPRPPGMANLPSQTVTVTCPFAMNSSYSVELWPISWAN